MLRRPLTAFATFAVAALAACVLAAPAAAPASGAPPIGAPPSGAPLRGIPDRAPIVSEGRGPDSGTVILIHGGAWVHHGPQYSLREHRRHAPRLNALGYDTRSITYRPGAAALPDVLAFYDGLRRRLGRRETICAAGDSAGGHLALMLAARRPGLDCAIGRGAPTDLRRAEGVWKEPVERRLAPYVSLASISPVLYADRLAGRVLASHARHDPLVDIEQLARLRRAGRGYVRTIALPPGRAEYVHASVDAGALERLEQAEAGLLRAASRRR